MDSDTSTERPEPGSAEEIVRGCQQGDRDAQRELYERCHGRVFRLMVRMVGRQDAGDLVQQVFLRAFRAIGQFSGKSKVETWLYRLAANEALQHLRKRQRVQQPLATEPESREAGREQRLEQRELLEVALERLEPELKSIFLLREVEELSYEEIAQTLDISTGTVGSRLNRARRMLKGHLIELGWMS